MVDAGLGNIFNTMRVIMPSVPSLPMNRCFRSKPALFLIILFMLVTTVPSANTASRPRTISRAIPYRITRLPPALVERLPPMAQDPRAPRSSGQKKPASAAACCTVSNGVPARTVMVAEAGSISSMPTILSIESAIWSSPARAPPHKPVKPPCGTTAIPCKLQRCITVEIPWVSDGRTTASGRDGNMPL
ncbi:MAG: hypothetical protein ACD_23C00525G0001 [uncultured bacterium]|nr:MAG: hypothetical protein ACD_23C00525G0001 [uncultured bacterium]